MCSTKGIQVLLFIENFFFWLVGAGLIGIGTYLLVAAELPGILQFLSGATILCYLAIGVGGFLFLLGLMGCCGAAYHNDCLLRAYVFILVVFIAAEIGVGVYIGLGFGVAQLEKIWNAFDDTSTGVIHTTFKCCGFYNASNSFPNGSPSSCEEPDTGATYQTGCYTKITTAITDLDIILLCVGAALALIQLLGIIMSCYLACNKKEYEGNQVIPLQHQGNVNHGYR